MARPRAVLGNPPVLLRRLTQADAPEMPRVVAESVEHLRPWMAWAAATGAPRGGAGVATTGTDHLRRARR